MIAFSDERFYIIVLFWYLFALSGLSLLGGWFTLARHYRRQNPRLGQHLNSLHFCSVRLSFLGSYQHMVQVRVYEKGIKLSLPWLFRLFHPAIYLRWDHIVDAHMHEGMLGQHVELHTDNNMKIKIFGTIKHSLFDHYLQYSTRGESLSM